MEICQTLSLLIAERLHIVEQKYLDKYKPGKILNCQGLSGIIIFPRKRNQISVVWQGMDEIDDYSPNWLEENCVTEEESFIRRHQFPRFP